MLPELPRRSQALMPEELRVSKLQGEIHEQELTYRNNLGLDPVEFRRQAEGQAAGFNKMIEDMGGFAAVKKRAQKLLDKTYRDQETRAGHAYGEKWAASRSQPEGTVPLHEPDVGAGGLPTSIFRFGNAEVNSHIGSQAMRILRQIANMPDNTNWFKVRVI
jgi:hypothetical protein